ncbi:MAG TPA: diaminopimelate decarboxylase [Bryobacteraceae bacterium]|nr:diaminopimelate decarboxylase [Bryobacteraceae bacterium]
MLIDNEYTYRRGVLFCEDVSLADIAAKYGTPAYVYSGRSITNHYLAYETALASIPHRICYAVKANSNIAILQLLARLGACFDIVSGGELYRVLQAGASARRVVFSGVGKTSAEIEYALEQGIYAFNCESEAELFELSKIAARMGRTASIAFRVNPDVDAATHPYISTGLREHKFGIGLAEVEPLYKAAAELPGIAPEGVSCHIGSQLLDYSPILEALEKVLALVTRLRDVGIAIRHLDIGGGIGARYRSTDHAPCPAKFAEALIGRVKGGDIELMLEPGRSIVAEAGVLLTRVILSKQNGAKTFVVTDAAMNDLVRPTLYQAYHEIVPVSEPISADTITVDLVGPVCETGDFFAHQRAISECAAGDLLALQTAGAYGFALSSNYNSRPRAAEILIDGDKAYLIRARELMADLIRGEALPQGWSASSAQ